MFISQCPKCMNRFESENEWLEQQAECPYCQSLITIKRQQFPKNDTGSKTGSNSFMWMLVITGIIIVIIVLLGLCSTGINSMISYSEDYKEYDYYEKELTKGFIDSLPDEQQKLMRGGGGASEDRMNFYANFMNADSETRSAVIKSMEE